MGRKQGGSRFFVGPLLLAAAGDGDALVQVEDNPSYDGENCEEDNDDNGNDSVSLESARHAKDRLVSNGVLRRVRLSCSESC